MDWLDWLLKRGMGSLISCGIGGLAWVLCIGGRAAKVKLGFSTGFIDWMLKRS